MCTVCRWPEPILYYIISLYARVSRVWLGLSEAQQMIPRWNMWGALHQALLGNWENFINWVSKCIQQLFELTFSLINYQIKYLIRGAIELYFIRVDWKGRKLSIIDFEITSYHKKNQKNLFWHFCNIAELCEDEGFPLSFYCLNC